MSALRRPGNRLPAWGLPLILGLLLAGGIVLYSSAYVVDEVEQAVILQFGRPVGGAITEPGLHFKTPFVQEVRRFDKRLLTWDGDANQIPTRGREFILVDTTARWRIVDPLKFLQSVNDEAGAQSRLDDIIDSVVRDTISRTELVEIVRSSDWDVTPEMLEQMEEVPLEEGAPELTRQIVVGREQLTKDLLREASRLMPQYGIELVDVRIKRLNYVPTVEEQVFTRMISERQRVAEQFRSEGQGEASRIAGETSLELARIRSEAQRAAEVIRGEADGEATSIYNQAYTQSPEFYGFYRTLESYRRTLGGETTLVLDSGSDYLSYLRQMVPTPKP